MALAVAGATLTPSAGETTIDTVSTAYATGGPNVHRTVKLSDGTLVSAYDDGTSIKLRTATSPYQAWSPAVTVAAGQTDFAIASGANAVYLAFEDASQALSVVVATRSGSGWNVGSPAVVESAPVYAPALAYSSDGALALTFERYTQG